jgi:hypothetical protein
MSAYEGEHMIFGLLGQANLTQNDVLQFHPFNDRLFALSSVLSSVFCAATFLHSFLLLLSVYIWSSLNNPISIFDICSNVLFTKSKAQSYSNQFSVLLAALLFLLFRNIESFETAFQSLFPLHIHPSILSLQ